MYGRIKENCTKPLKFKTQFSQPRNYSQIPLRLESNPWVLRWLSLKTRFGNASGLGRISLDLQVELVRKWRNGK